MVEPKSNKECEDFKSHNCQFCRKNFTTYRGLKICMRSHKEPTSIPKTNGNISYSDINETDLDDDSSDSNKEEFIEDDTMKKQIKQVKVKVATYTAGWASISVRENLRNML